MEENYLTLACLCNSFNFYYWVFLILRSLFLHGTHRAEFRKTWAYFGVPVVFLGLTKRSVWPQKSRFNSEKEMAYWDAQKGKQFGVPNDHLKVSGFPRIEVVTIGLSPSFILTCVWIISLKTKSGTDYYWLIPLLYIGLRVNYFSQDKIRYGFCQPYFWDKLIVDGRARTHSRVYRTVVTT